MLRALGADLSLTGAAWATGPSLSDIERLHTKVSVGADEYERTARLITIRTKFHQAVVALDPELVLIEGYSFASPQGAHQMGELGGQVRVLLTDMGVPWVTCTPNNRAKFASGSGNANKAQVTSAMAARTGITFPTDDHADALALWCMVQEAYGFDHALGQLPKANLEAMRSTCWPTIGGLDPKYLYKPKPKPKKKAAR